MFTKAGNLHIGFLQILQFNYYTSTLRVAPSAMFFKI